MRTRTRRWRIAAIAAVCAVMPVDASASAAPRKTFHAETQGSPYATVQGSWSEDEPTDAHAAQLTIEGGHFTGDYTTFEGSWIAPASTSSKKPQLSISKEITYSNTLGRDIRLLQAVRARFPGGKWGRWIRMPLTLKGSDTNTLSDGTQIVVPLKRPARVIFQWKVTGTILGPASIAADFTLSVT